MRKFYRKVTVDTAIRHFSGWYSECMSSAHLHSNFAPILEVPNHNILEYVMNMIPYSILWQDVHCVFLGCNEVFAKSLGLNSSAEIVGRTIFELPRIDPEVARRLIADNQRVMRTGIPDLDIEEVIPDINGRFFTIHTSKIPMRNSAGEVIGIIATFRDISSIKRTERDLADAKTIAELALAEVQKTHAELRVNQATLMQSAKMASLGVMASGLAHEINNPLAIIKGNIESLQLSLELGSADPVQILAKSETINKTVDRIAKIIHGLRTFAHESSTEDFAKTNVSHLIDDTLSFCSAKFRNHGIEVSVQVDPECPEVQVRPVQISQVILNLLNNAYDAVEKDSIKWIQLEVLPKAEGVEFAVMNSGNKIAPEIAARITEPFFTTKEVGKGTGLGLSISQGILEAHQGRLYIDPDCDHTRIAFWVPKHS